MSRTLLTGLFPRAARSWRMNRGAGRYGMLLLVLAVIGMAGCVSKKDVNYLHDPALSNTAKLFENQKFEYRIQVNDVLSIRVIGLNEEESRFFNVIQSQGGNGFNDVDLYVNGFSVDKVGQVALPNVGRVKVQGLTVGEAQEVVQRKISEQFAYATVILKLVSYRISVLGDVSRPGYYTVYNNQINLLEALALAGGPNEYANKEKITLMRPSDRGTQAVLVNLNQLDVLSSEYYFLLPNDVVYVPTLRARSGRLNLELLSIFITSISAAVLLLTFARSLNN
ncbi:MAG: polysaccharide biosynthesis/export family protein [Flavobacteriales bacterium]|nr:polysaccharide biosynthesis/export family protein [Flavobacteriales bacterium]